VHWEDRGVAQDHVSGLDQQLLSAEQSRVEHHVQRDHGVYAQAATGEVESGTHFRGHG